MSSSELLTLKKVILNIKPVDDLNKLKEILDIDTDEVLIECLLCLVQNEIEKSKSNSIESDKLYIQRLYDYIKIFVVADGKMDYDLVNKKFAHITKYIRLQLYNLKREKDVSLFKRFWDSIDRLNIHAKGYVKNKIDNDNEKELKKVNKYALLEDIVYNIKSIYLLDYIKNSHHNILITRNTDGKLFFTNLIIRYLKLLRSSISSVKDIKYFDTVIDIFLSNPNLIIDNEIKELIKKEESNWVINKNYYNDREMYFFHLKRKIVDGKIGVDFNKNKYVYSLDELNTKYNSNSYNFNYDIPIFNHYLNNDYVNMTDKNVITIDGISTVDADDAFSLEKLPNGCYLLGIYIADVSSYVKHNSYYDIEALHNIESIYYNKKLLRPMLPNDITSKCSLMPGDIKHTVAWFFTIDEDGNVLNYYLKKANIEIKAECHLTYDGANDILKRADNNTYIYQILEALRVLMDKGIFNTLNTYSKAGSSMPHIIVDKLMLLANQTAGMKAREIDLPLMQSACPIIDHEILLKKYPSLKEDMRKLAAITNSSSLETSLCDNMSKSYYTIKPETHKAMNGNVYCKVSSPIRRYVDLLNQRLLCFYNVNNNKFDDKQIYIIEEVLNEVAKYLNDNKDMADRYIADYAHIKK